MAQTAQERLAALERNNSPIEEQILQAATFAGFSHAVILERSRTIPTENGSNGHGTTALHGRQEYSLRWLLKKLHEKSCRECAPAWRLLRLLLSNVSTRHSTSVLSERKFAPLLRMTLEEAVARQRLVSHDGAEESSETLASSPKLKSTKKRKRDRETIEVATRKTNDSSKSSGDTELLAAVYETVSLLMDLSKNTNFKTDGFLVDYLKSIFRTSDEESGRILGSWLQLVRESPAMLDDDGGESPIDPFIMTWEMRPNLATSLEAFSSRCVGPVAAILCDSMSPGTWKVRLERLLSRNLIVPARTAFAASKNAALLQRLLSNAVKSQPFFAPVILELAIRSLPPSHGRPRHRDDTHWLQQVFSTCLEHLSPGMGESAVVRTLQTCISHKVTLDMPLMQTITTKFGLNEAGTNWDVVSHVIRLDAKTLLPSYSEKLSKELSSRITTANLASSWPSMVDTVVDDVIVPLMQQMFKERQGVAFFSYWLEQLVAYESASGEPHMLWLSTWEDDSILATLKDLLEVSLTTSQIASVLEELQGRIEQGDVVGYVLLNGILGAITRKETIQSVQSTVRRSLTTSTDFHGEKGRYKLHKLAAIATYQCWSLSGQLLQSELSTEAIVSSLLQDAKRASNGNDVEKLEVLRYLCAAWSNKPMLYEDMLTTALIQTIEQVHRVVDSLISGALESNSNSDRNVRRISLHRGPEWLVCAYLRCLFLEYPEVLRLLFSPLLPKGRDLLKKSLWLASAATSYPDGRPGLEDLATVWLDLLADADLENNADIYKPIIGAVLECGTHAESPFQSSVTGNAGACVGFVIRCLHHIPVELLSKSNREAVFTTWTPDASVEAEVTGDSWPFRMDALHPAVMSLKLKMMEYRPTLYSNISSFKNLSDLAELVALRQDHAELLLSIFERLVALTLGIILTITDQSKGQDYIQDMLKSAKEWIKQNRQAKSAATYAMTALIKQAILALRTKELLLVEGQVISEGELTALCNGFRDLLYNAIKRQLAKPDRILKESSRLLSLSSSLDALDALGLGEDDSLDLDELSMPAIELAQRINPKQGRQLRSFMSKRHQKSTTDCYEALASSHSDFTSNVATAAGQRNLKQEVDVLRERLAGHEKLSLARKLVDDEVNSTARFGKLSALNYLLPHLKDKSDSGEGANEDVGLSSLYLILIAGLRVSHNIDEHHALCHAMETILVSKARSVTQHNIESTLETITILCSSSAPRLPATYAAEIYSGFLSLLRLIMNNHRVKIQGRLHVVVQTLKALLRCLVAPAYSDAPTASSALAHRPSWLHSREHQLDLSHAEAFTRLVTAICDPTTSSVAGFQDHGRPSLHSATKEAKQYAGQHMPNLLAQYLQLELDTSVVMKQGVRDALRPGLYATLQCAGRTGRTWLAESVDSAARALLNELIREWSTFGKWQG